MEQAFTWTGYILQRRISSTLMTRLSSILSRLHGDFYERVLGVFSPLFLLHILYIHFNELNDSDLYRLAPDTCHSGDLSPITAYSAQWRCHDSSAMVLSSGTSNPLL
jgi:hypothetical protein